ncbi:hypothetical protein WA1_21095 [Scytonema hofmannii PCC 7110]|uniref:Uncharacterized protein n=1 Tax=Scytonema hofmannii PCC 7110 TaxID=128403 RepID=A0A139XCT5_9CYAN|nr:hypothetical protein [Scytonema hofmannii]KYC42463.1 hypothetical protein WA1_21095 [Scytonema hofmannii PCC 7110]
MSIKPDLRQSFMTQLLKTTSFTRTISKSFAIGLVVCSALSVSFLSSKSSYAYSAFKNNDYYIAQTKQNPTQTTFNGYGVGSSLFNSDSLT